MKMESYSFQNIYLISTYRCNLKCPFCLFRFNKEIEAPIEVILNRLKYSIKNSLQRVYLKITGGEPFLRPKLMKAVFKLCEEYPDKIYKIGIGTNGTIKFPAFFKDVRTRTHIFMSRHRVSDAVRMPSFMDLAGDIAFNPEVIDFRVNCNLIRDLVDDVDDLESVIHGHMAYGIRHICFRELSKVSIDANEMYNSEIYNYENYYRNHLVSIRNIERELTNRRGWLMSRRTGNYYDHNTWYWYRCKKGLMSVKFRAIDESRLIEFNRKNDGVDEYVIHPDGTLTGCWDKELKIIKERG